MKIKEIKNKKKWNEFILQNKSSFLQSWQWGEVRKKQQKVIRIGFFKKDSLKGACQIFEEKLPFGKYFHISYGPIVSEEENIEEFVREIKRFSKGKADFVRLEPSTKVEEGIVAFKRHQPRQTLVVNLKDEENLLSEFNSNVRYSVRKAKREGVEFKQSQDISLFYKVLQIAAKRHGFNTYSKDYFKEIINSDIGRLFVATHKDEIVAATVCIFFGDTVTYLHAGTNYKKRKLRASGFLNFKVMSVAYKEGFKKYDFWGIDKEKMPGVTKFKKGFGGMEVDYPKAKDIPLTVKYKAYKTIYKLK